MKVITCPKANYCTEIGDCKAISVLGAPWWMLACGISRMRARKCGGAGGKTKRLWVFSTVLFSVDKSAKSETLLRTRVRNFHGEIDSNVVSTFTS